MSAIPLNLTLEETNLVLEALGQMPYARVYLLIQKIQQQATEHLQEERDKGSQNGKQAEGIRGIGNTGGIGGKA